MLTISLVEIKGEMSKLPIKDLQVPLKNNHVMDVLDHTAFQTLKYGFKFEEV